MDKINKSRVVYTKELEVTNRYVILYIVIYKFINQFNYI
jgi:hypothetical protein